MKYGFEPVAPSVHERILNALTEEPAAMSDETALVELPADVASRRLREDMDRLQKARQELQQRQRELDEEEAELLLNAIMQQMDPLCVRLGITIEKAAELLQKEAERRGNYRNDQ